MAPFDDWNKVDEDEEDELLETTYHEGKRDVVLFAIDCSESMQALHDDPKNEGQKTSHLLTALEAAMQIQKRKVVVGPNDSAGILLFNTSRKNDNPEEGATEFKPGTYLYESVSQISAPKIMSLVQLLNEARDNHEWLRYEFPPSEHRVPIGDVFTSCNWAIRDGAPKSSVKRVFFITDEDDPHPGARNAQLTTSSQTTFSDLTQAGVLVEPFFISTDEKAFDTNKFYSALFNTVNEDDSEDDDLLPENISIGRIDDILAQMRFREMPKRALLSIPFELGDGFVIGVKGYGLVSEQKKGSYRYFVDLGDRLEAVEPKTVYVDDIEQTAVDRSKILYGMQLGPPSEENEDEEPGVRSVPKRSKVFFTADEIKSFRTFGLSPGIKLLGFKDKSELAIEDNIKHATFIQPDEQAYSGSKRTFTALLKTLVKKNKIGLVRTILRSNSAPVFCALLPQEEKTDENGFSEPAGFHLIPYPFADDLRPAPIEKAARAEANAVEAAQKWIAKLQIKNGGYPPDANPNPALAYHYAQLEASAFRQDFNPGEFEDPTRPKLDMIHKRAGSLIKEWKQIVESHALADTIFIQGVSGTKRKADTNVSSLEVRSMYESGRLDKCKVDQLKEFLKSEGQPASGKKADLIDRVQEYLSKK